MSKDQIIDEKIITLSGIFTLLELNSQPIVDVHAPYTCNANTE